MAEEKAEETAESKPRWRWGVNRWIVLALIAGLIYTTGIYAPITPHIQLPAERLSEQPLFGDVYLTNTIVAMIIANIIVILLAIFF